jgi:hypothetical protein
MLSDDCCERVKFVVRTCVLAHAGESIVYVLVILYSSCDSLNLSFRAEAKLCFATAKRTSL